MPEATDRYTATRLSAELDLDNRKMRDILTRVNPVQVKGRSKLYLLRDVIPHAAKYLGAPDVIDLNAERARKVKAEAELAEIELAKEREDLIQVEIVRQVWGELVIVGGSGKNWGALLGVYHLVFLGGGGAHGLVANRRPDRRHGRGQRTT